MSASAKWIGFSAVAVSVLIAACSGDDDGDGGGDKAGSSGSSSTAGSSSVGGDGKGGSVSNGGSVSDGGSTSNGGNVSGGGRGGTGGFNFGGTFNLGGAGFDPEEFTCDPAPTPGSACESDAQPCLNGTAVCYCDEDEWACTDIFGGGGGSGGSGFGQLDCPATKPSSGASCSGIGVCQYGDGDEGCACYGGMWACI